MPKKLLLLVLVAGLAGLFGCQDGVVSPPVTETGTEPLSAAELASVALESDALTEAVLDEELAVHPAVSGSSGVSGATDVIDIQFSRTRSCPAGGEIAVEGRLVISRDSETRTVEATLTGTRTFSDCAFVRGDRTVTVNGSTTLEAFRRRVEGRPDGLQTTTYEGSIHAVGSDGGERSCDFSVEVVVDPDARTRTVTGTICGDSIHRVVTWSPGG